MNRVIIESPYSGDVRANTTYARRAVHHSLMLGEAPIASHLLYTQPGILDDLKPEERQLGIAAGIAWLEKADLHIFYMDLGMSLGMMAAYTFDHPKRILRVRLRWLDSEIPLNWREQLNGYYLPATCIECYYRGEKP